MSLDTIPTIGLGTWELTGDVAAHAVPLALDLGYRHVDTAQDYDNEEEVGRAIAGSSLDRDDLWLTTKVSTANIEAGRVTESAEESLRRLGVDHVDLLLLHWPVAMDRLEENLGAMRQLQDRGLTRHIGVSNFTAAQVKRAAAEADIFTNQVEYHALLDQTAVLEAVRAEDAVLTAYSPLARGQLLDDPVITNVAGQRGASTAQIALRWLLDQDGVVAIPRSSSEGHLRANLEAASMQPLQQRDTAALELLPKDRRVIDPSFAPDWD